MNSKPVQHIGNLVPPNSIWVEGENASDSDDDRRTHGPPISRKLMIGEAVSIVYLGCVIVCNCIRTLVLPGVIAGKGVCITPTMVVIDRPSKQANGVIVV